MTLFWTIAVAMLALPIIVFIRVFTGKTSEAADDNTALNVNIAKERLAEIEAEHAKGDLSDEEFAQAKQDLEVALAEDISETPATQTATPVDGAGRIGLIATLIILPLMTYGVYQDIGSPQYLDVVGPGKPSNVQGVPDVAKLVVELEKRLNEEPDNPDGWFLLGRTYSRMGNYVKATAAFEKLNEVMPNNPTAMLSLADALAMQEGGRISGRSYELVKDVLVIDPNDITALWLGGVGAYTAGDTALAMQHWHKAYPMLNDNPEMQQELAEMIKEAGGELPQVSAVVAPAPVAPAAPQPILEGPGVLVQVVMDAELLADVKETDTVFVVAKAVSGPPMPLAVARKTVADLPIEVKLTDDMAMMPQMKISSFDQVEISARISESGQAIAEPNDVGSNKVVVSSNSTEPVQLLIAR